VVVGLLRKFVFEFLKELLMLYSCCIDDGLCLVVWVVLLMVVFIVGRVLMFV